MARELDETDDALSEDRLLPREALQQPDAGNGERVREARINLRTRTDVAPAPAAPETSAKEPTPPAAKPEAAPALEPKARAEPATEQTPAAERVTAPPQRPRVELGPAIPEEQADRSANLVPAPLPAMELAAAEAGPDAGELDEGAIAADRAFAPEPDLEATPPWSPVTLRRTDASLVGEGEAIMVRRAEHPNTDSAVVELALTSTFAPQDTARLTLVDMSPVNPLATEDMAALQEQVRRAYPSVSHFDVDWFWNRRETLAQQAQGALAALREAAPSRYLALAALQPRPQARFTSAFRARQPEVEAALRAELGRMVPADAAVRLSDRLLVHGLAADEVVSGPAPFAPGQWVLSVALAGGPAKARIKGFHGIAAHLLRGYGEGGLYTHEEWHLLLDHAKKERIKEEMQAEQIGRGLSLWEAYTRAYAQYGPSRLREYLDQELVGRLAEKWAAGTSFGARVDSLLERIARFLEAIRNALRGLGFQTADDVFERVVSGEVARRSEDLRREPTFGTPGREAPPDDQTQMASIFSRKPPDKFASLPKWVRKPPFGTGNLTRSEGGPSRAQWIEWAEWARASPASRAAWLEGYMRGYGTPEERARLVQDDQWELLIEAVRRAEEAWQRGVEEFRRRGVAPSLTLRQPRQDEIDSQNEALVIERDGSPIGHVEFRLRKWGTPKWGTHHSPEAEAQIKNIALSPGEVLSDADMQAVRYGIQKAHPSVVQFQELGTPVTVRPRPGRTEKK